MDARILVVGRELFPNGSSINVVARGGPIQPFGYLLHVLDFIPLNNPDFHVQSISRFSKLSTTGKIVSHATRTYNGDMLFDLETTSNIYGNFWSWTIRYVLLYFPHHRK